MLHRRKSRFQRVGKALRKQRFFDRRSTRKRLAEALIELSKPNR
jgi:hypothetical protein